MKKSFIITAIILMVISNHHFLLGQKLVVNPGFDQYQAISNPYLCDSIYICNDWYSPTNGSPDYFSIEYNQDTGCWANQVPLNFVGHQFPWNGSGYWGLGIYTDPISFPNDREYIQSNLLDTLLTGVEYCVSIYVSLADTAHYATDGLTVLFSDTAVENYNIFQCDYCLLPGNPQIVAQQIISDKDNWTRIEGTFIAQGEEQYITIGNFKNDANTDTLWIPGGTTSGEPLSYYYIDAVCVYDCSIPVYPANAGEDKIICTPGEAVTIGTPAIPNYEFFWHDASGELLER